MIEPLVGGLILTLAASGCVSYGGVTKAADGKVYLAGSTGYLLFSSSWVKRCIEKGTELVCEELAVKSKADAAPAKPKKSSDEDAEEEEEAPKKRRRSSED